MSIWLTHTPPLAQTPDSLSHTDTPQEPDTQAVQHADTAGADVRRRMQVMTDTTDGFQIAEEDLKLRGPGDLEGTQQSGDGLHLRLANLAKDGILVQWARDAATQVLSADPSLASPMGQMLRRQLDQEFPDRQDWGKIS